MELLEMAEGLVSLLGPGGAVAVLLTYMEWKSRKAPSGVTEDVIRRVVGEEMAVALRQIEDLHVWHDREDEDGVKVWYVRRSLERAIEGLTSAVEHLSRNQDILTALLKKQMENADG